MLTHEEAIKLPQINWIKYLNNIKMLRAIPAKKTL